MHKRKLFLPTNPGVSIDKWPRDEEQHSGSAKWTRITIFITSGGISYPDTKAAEEGKTLAKEVSNNIETEVFSCENMGNFMLSPVCHVYCAPGCNRTLNIISSQPYRMLLTGSRT